MNQRDLPPHSVEAEQTVLGALLLENDCFDTVSEIVGAADFYLDAHRVLWRAITELIAAGKVADPVTVLARLEAKDDLEQAGGREFLAAVAYAAPTARTVKRYAEIVRERSILRQIAAAAVQMQTLVSNPTGQPAGELLEQAQALLERLADQQGAQDIAKIGDHATEFLNDLERRMEHEGIQGIATGLADLDRMTNGLQAGDFVVIAGRPSMGKTALGMQIAETVASAGKSVIVFALEMGCAQLLERMVANVGRVDANVMRSGAMRREHWDGISAAVGKIAQLPLWVDDRPGLSVPRMRAKCRKIARKAGLDLVVVDYIGLMEGDGENRYAQVSDVSRRLKLLARELGVPVIGLAQLNRQTQGRSDKRPLMSDLRDSGAIEQDSDLILLMHREDYYSDTAPEFAGIAEVIVAKQRMGETGTVHLHFIGAHSRFESVEHGWHKPEKEVAKPKPKLK